jgi:WD40 repeat protein/serine/threonine protein kinase
MATSPSLSELLNRWNELQRQGRAVSPEALCADCPERLAELKREIAAVAAREGFLGMASDHPLSHAGRPGAEDEPATLPPPPAADASLHAAPTVPPADPEATRYTPQPPEAAPSPWPSVAGYEILGELGRGGMGVVYKARQVALNRLVALKMILAGAHAGEPELARFRTEAEAVARLQHPNIVQIHEVGEADGKPFFSLEYCAGGSLADKLDGTPLPPHDAARLVETLARAMDAAHRAGIIHRDLKPANILLTFSGRSQTGVGQAALAPLSERPLNEHTPKITDFGLAKKLDSGSGQTASGAILGTPSYMAPEQAGGQTKEVGPLADVYALGAILYQLLTGRPPFKAATAMDTLLLVLSEEPVPPRRLQPKTPVDLETLCLKCLQKETRKRHASAEALADDLRRFLNREPILARRTPAWERGLKWARRRPALAALLGVSIVAVLATLGGSMWYNARLRKSLAETDEQRAKADEQRAKADEQRAKADEQRAKAEFAVVRLYTTNGMRLVDEGNLLDALPWVVAAMWKEEDDEQEAKVHRTRLAAILRECPRLVQLWLHDAPLTDAEFSPDGSRVVTASQDGKVRIWDARTGEEMTPILQHRKAVRQASFSPNSRRIVTACEDGTARIWNAATGQPLVELRHQALVHHGYFSPDGKRVLTCGDDGRAQVWNAATGQPIGSAMNHRAKVRYASFSPDGSRVATASDDGTARMWDATTGEPHGTPLQHAGKVYRASFSPDGRFVVTASADGTARVWTVATANLLMPPLKHGDEVRQARFSPDGHRILTASDDGLARLWDAATGAPLAQPMRHGSAVKHACFNADGHWVVTASDDNTVRVWDAATGEPRTCPLGQNGTVQTASLSHDGHSVLIASVDHTARIWDVSGSDSVAPRPGPRTKLEPPTQVSRDGTLKIQFNGDTTAQVVEIATGRPVTAPMPHGSTILGAAFSPDGSKIVTASDDNTARVWEAGSGKALTAPLRHTGAVTHAAFSSDSAWIVTASGGDTVRVWDVRTGQPIIPPLRHSKEVKRAIFGPDDHQIMAQGEDDQAWIWDLPFDDRPAWDLLLLAQLLAGGSVDEAGGLVPVKPGVLELAWQQLRAKYPRDFAPRAAP